VRPFAPPSFGINRPDFHAGLIEWRLAHSGEYVSHLPTIGGQQWAVMNYQFIPVDASLSVDYLIPATNPKLFGYLDHFATKPELYREGDSVRPSRGSQFEVRGLTYNVKKVDVNHVGYVHIELVLDDKCVVVRPEFFTEQEGLTCLDAPNCEVI
jgi:hypothetical protein